MHGNNQPWVKLFCADTDVVRGCVPDDVARSDSPPNSLVSAHNNFSNQRVSLLSTLKSSVSSPQY
ncbi:hypothetical protein KFK09_003107 [Dendrobium nobile]|uniref:Uncharacterized protein n=1 Tax=Dendrobium nobile TaxID=94219 RepID=A0A8T3C3K1_DENNO|nr:hypothetical protein KFK09_003107 [Dendrobium nobile]